MYAKTRKELGMQINRLKENACNKLQKEVEEDICNKEYTKAS